jgi:hypothetical protein
MMSQRLALRETFHPRSQMCKYSGQQNLWANKLQEIIKSHNKWQ